MSADTDLVNVLLGLQSQLGRLAGTAEETRHSVTDLAHQLRSHLGDEAETWAGVREDSARTNARLDALGAQFDDHLATTVETHARLGALEAAGHRSAGARAVIATLWGAGWCLMGWAASTALQTKGGVGEALKLLGLSP